MPEPTKTLWLRRCGRILRIALYSYLGVLFVLWLLENYLVYRPSGAEEWVAAPSPEIVDVTLTSDDLKIHAWWLPCPGASEAVLYCHGNAGNLSHRGGSILKVRELLQVNVLIFDYPGYGKSEGSASEPGCCLAGEAAYDWLVNEKKIDPRRIILYGGSLGGGVAVDLASRKPHRALVLAKTFTSCPDIAAEMFPWLPVRWLMRNRFDNLTKIKACSQPVFIGHGTLDTIVPFHHGQRLFEAASEPKRFFPIDRADHNDRLPLSFFECLREFLEKHPMPES